MCVDVAVFNLPQKEDLKVILLAMSMKFMKTLAA